MAIDIRCKKEDCPYRELDLGGSRMWPYKCASPPGGKAIITDDGRCETYMYAKASGKVKSVRSEELSDDENGISG